MPVFALVDCNNFYASCETLFRPDLRGLPVAVLSNNDGCVVARSAEVKALGIKMGEPLFKIRHLVEKHHIHVFSSNYELYGDLSARVMQTLEEMAPACEVYSIDEAFLDVTGIDHCVGFEDFGHQVRNRISQWIGITVCVGIGPTKTLAKLANRGAKKYKATGGVVDLTSRDRQRRIMRITPVGDVWGVGSRISARLIDMGIKTALDLADTPLKQIRGQFSVVLERTVAELNGDSCLDLETVAPTKKEIVVSRSFGQRVTEYQAMREAVASYMSRAAEKLRAEQQQAKYVQVFIRTSPFAEHEPQYARSIGRPLASPSNDTRTLTAQAQKLLSMVWQSGFRYAKAGVMLSDFYSDDFKQYSLFSDCEQPHSHALMTVLDTINQGEHKRVVFAGQGMRNTWQTKRGRVSPAYTTRWADLCKVK